ncbi:molybdopterin-binding protein [Acetivibrio ethanolgignens]|uniref:Molybdopterin molybdenumtransferase n=1 Tax=Acetivibrio ethanolgignens TaxID=290052 RepID=A0A0V8QAI4_9FIRM|nr:molybdopterin-binding protein [Acetivibrio ethanolgignens]KSV57468.1 molybdopterin-binding protein [Acetivibrio ethanolgignens]
MKLIKTEDAVGHVLCHDITQIIKGVTRDAVFRKGHVVREEDIPVLLSVGKDHLYIWEKEEGMLHENEGAEILDKICRGENMEASEPKEGKIEWRATYDGLLKVDRERLYKINAAGELMAAVRHGNFPVKKGDKLGGTRIIPLVIEEEKLKKVEKECAGAPVLTVLPFRKKTAGIITTGNEVFYGRIQDTFTPVLEEKLSEYDAVMTEHVKLPDNHEEITKTCLFMIEKGVDMVLVSGGMSVDPDDKTPLAIKNTGARIVSYGAPVLPGAMFLLAYYERDGKTVPIMGLPGCVMYAKRTVFDLVLPRIMAEDPVTREELAALGEGGMCLSCEVCTFPNCGFGKGK